MPTLRPGWLEVRQPLVHSFDDDLLSSLGEGERAAIKLVTTTLRANTLLLMDDRAAVHVARHIGLTVTGTIGVLEEATQRGLLDLDDAFARLRHTTFRYPEGLIQELLAKHKNENNP